MPATLRTRIQEAALGVLAAAAVVAALWFAQNGFMAAAFLGTATICLIVLTSAALIRRDPNVWEPRLDSRKATAAINALSIAVIALYVLGLFFIF